MPLQNGDRVKVYPRGESHKATEAIIAVVSKNQRSIIVGFGDKPPFIISTGGMAMHAEFGIVMIATREDSGGCGCWIEMFGGGRFEIEAAA